MNEAERIEVAVIGAGVVGCAVASAVARKGLNVLLLEAGPRPGEGVSSRNSGVIHSGLYYEPDSLKARTCVRGNALLYAWCAIKGVSFSKCGKLIVATDYEEEEALDALFDNAVSCGASGVEWVSGKRLKDLEPSVRATCALFCPETGIVDAAQLTGSLLSDAVDHGAVFVQNAAVTGIDNEGGGYLLETSRGQVRAGRVVNSAGLYADDVARMAGVDKYRIHPCRGDYFTLKTANRYRRLVYPVRRKGDAGVGVHLTFDSGGRLRLGPDAQYVDNKDDFRPGEDKSFAFSRAVSRWLGPVSPGQLRYDTCGIRPKLRAQGEEEEKDFVVCQDLPGFINLVGIESPGLTACLALAEHVAKVI